MQPGVDTRAEDDRRWDDIFLRGIDPIVLDPSRCHAHSEVPETWPQPQEVHAYVKTVSLWGRGLSYMMMIMLMLMLICLYSIYDADDTLVGGMVHPGFRECGTHVRQTLFYSSDLEMQIVLWFGGSHEHVNSGWGLRMRGYHVCRQGKLSWMRYPAVHVLPVLHTSSWSMTSCITRPWPTCSHSASVYASAPPNQGTALCHVDQLRSHQVITFGLPHVCIARFDAIRGAWVQNPSITES